MSLELVERESEQHLQAEFAMVPIDLGQPGFIRPKGQAWIRHTVLSGLDTSVEVTADSYETTGLISVQIFTPIDAPEGRRQNARLYDEVAAVYRDAEFGGVRTYQPSRTVQGESDGWWQSNLTVNFETLTITN